MYCRLLWWLWWWLPWWQTRWYVIVTVVEAAHVLVHTDITAVVIVQLRTPVVNGLNVMVVDCQKLHKVGVVPQFAEHRWRMQ